MHKKNMQELLISHQTIQINRTLIICYFLKTKFPSHEKACKKTSHQTIREHRIFLDNQILHMARKFKRLYTYIIQGNRESIQYKDSQKLLENKKKEVFTKLNNNLQGNLLASGGMRNLERLSNFSPSNRCI